MAAYISKESPVWLAVWLGVAVSAAQVFQRCGVRADHEAISSRHTNRASWHLWLEYTFAY